MIINKVNTFNIKTNPAFTSVKAHYKINNNFDKFDKNKQDAYKNDFISVFDLLVKKKQDNRIIKRNNTAILNTLKKEQFINILNPDEIKYLNKLIKNDSKSINSLSKSEFKAFTYAIYKHQGKKRKHPDKYIPYFKHCYKVGLNLKKHGYNEDVVAAGFLHDVIEDTNTKPEEIEYLFNKNVISHINDVSHKDKNLSWEKMQTNYLEHLKTVPTESVAISAFDKINNMESDIEALQDGHNIFKKLKKDRTYQLKKYINLYEIYKNELPKEISDKYKATLIDLIATSEVKN